jgi:hypothetical protein
VLTVTWLLSAVADSPRRPAINTLMGIVVSKADGKPLAGIPVLMAHREKGYLRVGPEGSLDGSGEEQRDPKVFAVRNGRMFCDALTDDEGRFTLRNFAAPGEPWFLAAGNRQSGLVLRTDVVPADCPEGFLKIEMDTPADIIVGPLPEPADKSLTFSVDVDLAPLPRLATTQPAGDSSAETASTADEEVEPRVYIYPPYRSDDDKRSKEPWHLGPFPPGLRYRVTRYAYGSNIPYQATLFARIVELAPGATVTAVLESSSGAQIDGRVTDLDGKPLAGVNVMVKAQDETGIIIGAITDVEGRYEVKGLAAGVHEVELLRHVSRTGYG